MQANPGKYAIANAGLGTTPELAAELFKLDFKLDQPSVPYNGGAPADPGRDRQSNADRFCQFARRPRRTSSPERCTASR